MAPRAARRAAVAPPVGTALGASTDASLTSSAAAACAVCALPIASTAASSAMVASPPRRAGASSYDCTTSMAVSVLSKSSVGVADALFFLVTVAASVPLTCSLTCTGFTDSMADTACRSCSVAVNRGVAALGAAPTCDSSTAATFSADASIIATALSTAAVAEPPPWARVSMAATVVRSAAVGLIPLAGFVETVASLSIALSVIARSIEAIAP